MVDASDLNGYEDAVEPAIVVASSRGDDDYINYAANGDDDGYYTNGNTGQDRRDSRLPEDDEEMHESIEVDEEHIPSPDRPATNGGARKRKSSSLEDEEPSTHIPSPPQPAKKARTIASKQQKTKNSKKGSDDFLLDSALAPEAQTSRKGRPAGKAKASNLPLSRQQEAELGQIIDKVRARPGQQKSLYILRRETPADDSAVHTRSGRVSVKPLAYWRNERCVYGGSPGGANLADGARFPLNSIKEIIRTEEVGHSRSRSPSKTKGKGKKGKGKARAVHDEEFESDSDFDEAREDPDAEDWETSSGTYRGDVSIWDQGQQAPLEALEEVELAYAPAAIQTKDVKSMHPDQRSFRFAKLLSTSFFGSGIVDLAPGDLKRPKNSRKMHMSFYVAKGRVTVEIGALGGEMSRFSVGKGGFWQVPRGECIRIHSGLASPSITSTNADLIVQEISIRLRTNWRSRPGYSSARRANPRQ